MTKRDKLALLIPALWTSLFDIGVTIIHQPKEYWEGNLSTANEGNPIGSVFMKNHISGLFIVSALWLTTVALLGYFLPNKIKKVFLLFCVIAHSYGASTWISPRYGFWWVMLLILFNSILYNKIDKEYGQSGFQKES